MIALFTACDPGMAFSSAPTGEVRFGILNVRFCVPVQSIAVRPGTVIVGRFQSSSSAAITSERIAWNGKFSRIDGRLVNNYLIIN